MVLDHGRLKLLDMRAEVGDAVAIVYLPILGEHVIAHAKAVLHHHERQAIAVVRAMHEALLSRLAPLGLSLNQAIAVCYIHDHTEGPVCQRDLEREQGLTNPTITAMVKSMVANDVVYRIRDKNDGRFWQLKLTPHGIDLNEPARSILVGVNEQFEARLTDDELKTFYALEAKLLLDDEAEEERASREG